jgi:hypothetical protein
MSRYICLTNYVEDPEEIIRKSRAKLRKKKSPTTLSEEDQPRRSLPPVLKPWPTKLSMNSLLQPHQQSMWEKKDLSSSQP